MRTGPDQHVVPHEHGWAVKPEGGERASKVFPSRDSAIEYAHSLASKHQSHAVVHKEDGTFQGAGI
jgi:hypothetical protein